MNLLSAKNISKIIIESVAPGSLYRIMDIEELANIFKGKWDFANNEYENADIENNFLQNNKEDQKKLKNSEVYKKNSKFGYSKSFTRSLNPELLNIYFNEDSVIVEFDKEGLSNINNSKITPIDYQPYGKAYNGGSEMEDRVYRPEQSATFDPKKYKFNKLIKAVYFPQGLADTLHSDLAKLKSKGIQVGVIPYMDNYDSLTAGKLKRFLI